MIVIDLFYGLEVDHSFQLRLVFICYHGNNTTSSLTRLITNGYTVYVRLTVVCVILTCVVRQRPAVTVKDEPALLPRLDLSSHLDEEAATRFLRDGDVVASLDVVSGGFDVATQVEVVLPHRQVASQRTRLWVKQGSKFKRQEGRRDSMYV